MPEINPQELKVAENRRRFTEIYRSTVTREGADRLFAYLESTDFFSAPASTRYHGNYEGGLCQHSLNVYDCLCDILARPRMQEVYGIRYSDESIAIAALLHDLCKVNFYKTSFRNAKNEQGMMEARIAEIGRILSEATVVEAPKRSSKVTIGSTVTVDMGGRERVFTIVGGAEADVAAGKISNESPVGAALLAHKKGDEIETTGPTGRVIKMTILKIEH